MRYCHIQPCSEEQIPNGLKEKHAVQKPNPSDRSPSEKYTAKANQECVEHHNSVSNLDYLNKTLSEKAVEELKLWEAYDDALDNFCDIDEDDGEAEYMDLLLNPERFTGYVAG